MQPLIGFRSSAVVGKEEEYGNGASAFEVIPFISESITPTRERIVSDVKMGHGGREISELGKRKIAGTLSTELAYIDTDLLLAALMGLGGDTAEDLSGNGKGPWRHVLNMADINDRSVALVIHKKTQAVDNFWQYRGVKINKMTLKAEASNGIVTVDWEVFCKSFDYTNAPVAQGRRGKRALFEHISFRVGPIGKPVSNVAISSIELNIDRKLKGDDYTTESYPDPIEPFENDFRDVTLNISMPRFVYYDFINLFEDNQKLGVELEIRRSDREIIKFIFPTVEVAERPKVEINSAGIIPIQIQLVARRNYSNTIYADITEEVQIEIINDRSTPIWG